MRVTQTAVDRPLLPRGGDVWFDLDTGADWTFERGAAGNVVALVRKPLAGNSTRAARSN
jgi:hypothetical protein